jgi:polysaccharide export outer membrane protein
MRLVLCASATLAALALTGCSYGPSGGRVGETGLVQVVESVSLPAPNTTDTLGRPRSYAIGPQDVLIVDVFGIESLTDREIVVDGGGRISIPMAGTIDAVGHTPQELAGLIEERLRDGYMRDPKVSVNVKEAVSQVVTVDGQVMQPGMYPVLGDMTLADAVASARGLAEFAKRDDVVVLRTVGGQRYAGVYNLAAIRRGNYPDPEIYANDVVIVGDSVALRRMQDLITVLPAITSPLIYILDGNN